MTTTSIVRKLHGSRDVGPVGGPEGFTLMCTWSIFVHVQSSPIRRLLWTTAANREPTRPIVPRNSIFYPSLVTNCICACCMAIAVHAKGESTVRDIISSRQCFDDSNKLLMLGSSAGTERSACASSARELVALAYHLPRQWSSYLNSRKKCCFFLVAGFLIHCGIKWIYPACFCRFFKVAGPTFIVILMCLL